MKMTKKDIKNMNLLLNVNQILQTGGLVTDEESEQTEKILNTINFLQNKSKSKEYKALDELLGEIMYLKEIVAKKYIKLGFALEKSKEYSELIGEGENNEK